jgi:hypothetical protein
MFHFLDTLSSNFLKTLKRFPLVTISAYIMTIILFTFTVVGHGAIEKYPNYNVANKIAFLMTLAMPLFFLLRLLSKKWIFSLVGVAILIAYYFFALPVDLKGSNSEFFQQHFLWVIALFIFSIASPFLFRTIDNKDFWEWTEQILFALLATAIFSVVLFLGLEGAKYALQKLFDITIRGHRVEEQFTLIIFALFSINYFLSQIPKEPLSIVARPYTKVENIFTKYILTPLVTGYFLILFAYTAKIIYLGEWPTGVMAKLILIFSVLAILTLMFWTPLWSEKNSRYKKVIWVAILLQTFVLAMSIYLRIEQYGVTENRYYIALSGIWLSVTALYFIVTTNSSYKWIFVTIPLFIVFSQTPPFSAKEISKTSQVAKLQTLLGSSMPLSEDSNSTIKYQISSKVEYLFREHGIDSLMPVIPEIVTTYKLKDGKRNDCEVTPYNSSFPHYATRELGFQFIDQWLWEQQLRDAELIETEVYRSVFIHANRQYNNTNAMSIKGYDWLQSFSFFSPTKNMGMRQYCPTVIESFPNESNQTIIYTIKTDKDYIHIEKEEKNIANIKVDKFIKSVKEKWEKESKKDNILLRPFEEVTLNSKDLTLEYENGEVKVKILFQAVEFSIKEKKLVRYSGEILIHEK